VRSRVYFDYLVVAVDDVVDDVVVVAVVAVLFPSSFKLIVFHPIS